MQKNTIQKQPSKLLRILGWLHIFLGFGGLGGGIMMILDPTGQTMGLPTSLLTPLFIDSFLLPGLFLFLVMGCLPLLSAYGLWTPRTWHWMQPINPFRHYAWPWPLSLLLGILLIIWIIFQLLLWGTPIPIQIGYLVLGILLTIGTILVKDQLQVNIT